MKQFAVVFLCCATLAAPALAKVKVAVIDSGVDFTHPALKPVQFVNAKDKVDGKDNDGNGFVDDMSGWNMAGNNGQTFDPKDVSSRKRRYDAALKVIDYMARMQNGEQLTKRQKLELFALTIFVLSDINNIGTMIHGTHCAGIVAKDNTGIELLGVKMGFGGSAPKPKYGYPSEAELEKAIADMLRDDTMFIGELVRFLITQDLRVMNASWGISEAAAAGAFKGLYPSLPPDATLQIGRLYMKRAEPIYALIAQKVPRALFVVAAGNDSANNDKMMFFPANIKRENSITVAAVDSKGVMADFSNYGPGHVDIAAEGVNVVSSVPDNRTAPLSGTSMAAPNVTRGASLVFAANEKLTPAQVKKILMETSDQKPYLKRYVACSGILNAKRAEEAGKLSLTMSVEEAINASFNNVPQGSEEDPAREKTIPFADRLEGFTDVEKGAIMRAYRGLMR